MLTYFSYCDIILFVRCYTHLPKWRYSNEKTHVYVRIHRSWSVRSFSEKCLWWIWPSYFRPKSNLFRWEQYSSQSLDYVDWQYPSWYVHYEGSCNSGSRIWWQISCHKRQTCPRRWNAVGMKTFWKWSNIHFPTSKRGKALPSLFSIILFF